MHSADVEVVGLPYSSKLSGSGHLAVCDQRPFCAGAR